MSPLLPVSAAMAATVLGFPQGVQLLGCHAGSFDDGRIAATGELDETQTDDLLCLQAGLPGIK